MDKKIILFVLILLVLPLVNAEVYRQGTNVSLTQPCYNNDFYCSSSAECLITVTNPAGNITVSNQTMTNQIPFHNYTINDRNTSTGGVYDYCITCRDGAFNGSRCFEFTINPQGIDFSQSRTNAISTAIYIMFILGIILIFGGAIFVKFLPLKLSVETIGAIFLLIGINVLFVSLQNEVVNPRIENLFDTIVATSFILMWMAGGLLLSIWIISIFYTLFYRSTQKKLARFG